MARKFQEMHVDGGAIAQLFLYPESIDPRLLAVERRRPPSSSATPGSIRSTREIERRTLTIAGRAISTMLAASGYNDVLRVYFLTKRDGVDYNLAYIGSDFKVQRDQPFDQAYMRALYDYGYQQAVAGRAWHKTPPGLHTRRSARQEAAVRH